MRFWREKHALISLKLRCESVRKAEISAWAEEDGSGNKGGL